MTPTNILWLDSVLALGETETSAFLDCLMQLRAWMVDKGDPTGFHYPPTPGDADSLPWWRKYKTPFKVRAMRSCRVWRIPAAQSLTQEIATTPAYMLVTDARIMDVFETWMPGGNLPAWFVVWTNGKDKMICLADECEEYKGE